MQLNGAPSKLVEAFAINGDKRTIPVASQTGITPGAASYNDGFPPLTGTPVTQGGIPPSRSDMNGILFATSGVIAFLNSGGVFSFDSGFASSIGGYPKGARVLNNAANGYYVSLVDNNTADPNSGSTNWIPDRASASVYASGIQTIATGSSKIVWDTVEWDQFGLWNASAKAFQAIWPGKYRLSGSVYLPVAPANMYATSIYKNGNLTRNGSQYPQVSDGDMTYLFDGVVSCAAGDQLTATLFNVGSQVTAGQSSNNSAFVYGQIEFLGA